MVWKPHVTVAAIAESDGRFLLVEEMVGGRMVVNQPAGHLEEHESLVDAVRRETLEETAWAFEPEALVGIYRWHHSDNGKTFIRATFCGHARTHYPDQALDEGIHRALWLGLDDLEARREHLRSPLVLASIRDYRAGMRYPLDLLRDLAS